MCPRLVCRRWAGPRLRALLFSVAALLGWALAGLELGVTLVTDEPYLALLGVPEQQRPLVLAGLLAAHAASAALGGLLAGRWADSAVETRSLVIMAALPQLLGAALAFFAATLAELVTARVLAGLGAGAGVAVLCELLRVAPVQLRVAALAGLAVARELGADLGPAVGARLDAFPVLPTSVVRHRATPWNAAGLLLLCAHTVYLLLLVLIYPDLTAERETELQELRRLTYADAADADAADAANPYARLDSDSDDPPAAGLCPREVDARLAVIAVLESCGCREDRPPWEWCAVTEEPAPAARPPLTPTPSPGPPRSASELAAIGRAFANPGTPEPLPPPRREPWAKPPTQSDAEQGASGPQPSQVQSEDETDAFVTTSSLDMELQYPTSSRPPTSDEDNNPLNGTDTDAATNGPAPTQETAAEGAADGAVVGAAGGAVGGAGDAGLRSRRWPGSHDLTVAEPSTPLTPAEPTSWFTPNEVPTAAAGAPLRQRSVTAPVQTEAPERTAPEEVTTDAGQLLTSESGAAQPPRSHAATETSAAGPPADGMSGTGAARRPPSPEAGTVPGTGSAEVALPAAKPVQMTPLSCVPREEGAAGAAAPPQDSAKSHGCKVCGETWGPVPTADYASRYAGQRRQAGPGLRRARRPHQPTPRPADGAPAAAAATHGRRRGSAGDQPDGAAARRPLEGPYACAPEAGPDTVVLNMVPGDERRIHSVQAQRLMRRLMRSWQRVLCAPTLALLAAGLAVCAAQSALSSLLPREERLAVPPVWMLGMSGVMRLLTAAALVLTVFLTDGLGAGTIGLSLAGMAVAQLGLGLSLLKLHADTVEEHAAPEQSPSAEQLAWSWVLRAVLCLQGVSVAVFEPVTLAFLSELTPRTLMGRGVSLWALVTRLGVLIGPFWTIGLTGYPLPQFLIPMGALIGCTLVVCHLQCYSMFKRRLAGVFILDGAGPRLPTAGLRGRTVSVINHLRQFYCAEAGDVETGAEGGAAVDPLDDAAIAPQCGDRRPLFAAGDDR